MIYYRSFSRVLIESICFFFVPCVVSGFLYWKIAGALKEMQKHKNRNRNLTRAFLCGWILWVVCWGPNYLFLLYKIKLVEFLPHSWAAPLFFWGELLQLPVEMLFSQLNPFVYIIIFKTYRETLARSARFIYSKIMLILHKDPEKLDSQASSSESNEYRFRIMTGVSITVLLGAIVINGMLLLGQVQNSDRVASTFPQAWFLQSLYKVTFIFMAKT